ncbi:MAG: insulinase family protein [Acidobacteria bacterium]|nr:insulinase family protein [Acidobacteriota bacterium]
MRVILHEDRSTPIVGVNLWYHVGSKDEVPGKTGFAHLFEHMMFQGSKNYDDDYFKPLQQIAGGTLNGSTNPDRTNYWEVVPSNFLELALFMEADRMGGLLDVLDRKKFLNQQEVVKNEKRQNYDNRPYGLVGARINETLYPKDHPYHWLTIGSLDDLTAASLDDVKDFFRRFYTPNNASLAIAGDFDPAEARALVEKYFGPIARGPEVKKVVAPQPKLEGMKRVEWDDRVQLPRLYMIWHTTPQYTPEEPALDTLALILGGGKSSRLYKTLVYERQIAQSVSAFNNTGEMAGTLQIVATPKPGKTVAEIEGAINEEIERLKEQPPTAAEIERAYNAREASFIYGIQGVGSFGGKNDQLNQYATYLGRPDYFQEDLARYRRVQAADVRRVAAQYLSDDRLVVTITPRPRGGARTTGAAPAPESPTQAAQGAQPATQPAAAPAAAATQPAGTQAPSKTEAAATTPAGAAPPAASAPAAKDDKKSGSLESLMARLPKPKADPKLKLPAVQRRRLSNGLEVLFVEHKELPVVNMNLILKSGAAADPAERPGLATLTADLLDEGTKTRNALDISNALSDIGAQLSVGAGWDSTTASLTTLTRHLDRALDIYADVLLNPAFPEADFKRLRSSRLVSLQQQRDSADAIANNVYSSLLFGRGHPYGRSLSGDPRSTEAVAEGDVRAYYETHYRPNNAALVVSGDVTPAALLPKLERAFGSWKRGDVPAVSLSAQTPAIGKTTIYLVDRPGAAQSVIQIGHVGVARSTPDYFPLLVMNTMLGGQFTSRLNLNLREDKGYTYGANSGFSYRRGAGPFTASAGVQTAVTKESVVEFMRELRGIRGERPVTARELELAKQAIIRGFPRGFETPGQIAGRLSDVVLNGLPDDYFNNYIARVQAVTLADVERVAQKYLDPSRMAVLVVGDRKEVERGLRSLESIGTVTLLDAEGKPVVEGGGQR